MSSPPAASPDSPVPMVRIRGARQHTLRDLDLDIPTGQWVVVSGVSGAGKSSLVFDTLYAEGQRRYVETFSSYARQFLDRMDRPQVDRIEGIPPAIAIEQTNPVRTSRSTVGTMTELNDHLKVLCARLGRLHCRQCAQPVQRDTAPGIQAALRERTQPLGDPRLIVMFPVAIPAGETDASIEAQLLQQGYHRIHERSAQTLQVIQDRFRLSTVAPERLAQTLETALQHGAGRVTVLALDDEGTELARWRFATSLSCADCDITYSEPTPGLFSFNSALGACEPCRGFGKVIGLDLARIIPNPGKSLAEGAIKPWQSESYQDCQADLMRHAKRHGVATDIAWRDLPAEHRDWVIEGAPEWTGQWQREWFGIRRFFEWLETKAYKMPIRVLLARYRSATECPACRGARLRPEALLWRLGDTEHAACALAAEPGQAPRPRFMPSGVTWREDQLAALPGLCLHDLMTLPIGRLAEFWARWQPQGAAATASRVLLDEVRSRLSYLTDVGLSYLSLDRATRTLSGGELQRIHLVTALGSSLVNTLFVLDEPSVGLHPRDVKRVIRVIERLRDAGNTVVVIEHDPQMLGAADRVLDLGPGAGSQGGSIMYWGPPAGLGHATGLTADYLSGRRHMPPPSSQGVDASTPRLGLAGVCARNLKSLTVELPLQRLVCLTGVSGSGKSTLMRDVLRPALQHALGELSEAPPGYTRLWGAETMQALVYVDQSPIGQTARATPVSYVGAFDTIRQRFAATPAARERGYTASTFSFNAGTGRCPACGGHGFEHVEMQFLADVYLRCPDCDGRRFRPEVLEVTLDGPAGPYSIADVLAMTVRDALAIFSEERDLVRRLQILADVGLDYLQLGQPVPTLSVGEAQRLKLAGHLAESVTGKARSKAAPAHTLFLFDEPTTGLHSDDIARLLGALRGLVAAGHSVLVIEHNLAFIAASDWLIDLGPDAGERGGELIVAGPPQVVMQHPTSLTGQALREAAQHNATWQSALAVHDGEALSYHARSVAAPPACIHVHRARTHTLQDVDVRIPHHAMTVITGVSGSGKSSLAFDVIFGEGQRRYVESLSVYARQFVQPPARPDVEGVYGLPPTVAIEQRTSRGGRKSTVGTLTEVYQGLRLLYAKLGEQYCPSCALPVTPQSFEAILARLLREHSGTTLELAAPLVIGRKGTHAGLAKTARSQGFDTLRVNGERVSCARFPKLDRHSPHDIELPIAEVLINPTQESALRAALQSALKHGQGFVLTRPAGHTGAGTLHSTRRTCGGCGTSFPALDPRLFSFSSRVGWCRTCLGVGLEVEGRIRVDELTPGLEGETGRGIQYGSGPCPSCQGRRLNTTARAVQLQGLSLDTVTGKTVAQVRDWLDTLRLSGRAADISRDLLTELRARLDCVVGVGLAYLALDRAAPTLSGGEAQRLRLAAQLGSNLQGVCYVLDEPTIGLHPRDNRMLLDKLCALRDHGNTLVVVEHDEDTIRRADYVIDMGPGSGRRGGRVVATGAPTDLSQAPESLTGRYLAQRPPPCCTAARAVTAHTPALQITQARLHNLQDIAARIPLQRLTVVTGVSGSGKSSLVRGVLLPRVHAAVAGQANSTRRTPNTAPTPPILGLGTLTGAESLTRVLEVDQTPIGHSHRSCPATYIGFWDAIRRLFADTTEARMRGYDATRFSFNTGPGRCPVCEGHGMQTHSMHFLPDVKVVCEACQGQRFNPETLQVRLREHSIGDILAMDIDNALPFFAAHPRIHHPLELMQALGLGYLTLGQSSATLSGGEAQRIKLVTELAKARPRAGEPGGGTLYVLDEPTVGLHRADVEKLIAVLHRLVEAGHTVLVIEHQIDVWAEADWLIDLGPEGGDAGGQIVDAGPPQAIAERALGHTGQALRAWLTQGPPRQNTCRLDRSK